MEPSAKAFRESDRREPPNSRGMVMEKTLAIGDWAQIFRSQDPNFCIPDSEEPFADFWEFRKSVSTF